MPQPQHIQIRMDRPGKLQPHRQPAFPEPRAHIQCRQPRQRERRDDLHPPVVRVALHAGHLGRPVQLGVERKHLRRRRQHEVEALEQLEKRAVHVRAVVRGLVERGRVEVPALLYFPLRLGLELSEQLRVAQVGAQLAAHQQLPQAQPGAPVVLARHVERAGLDLAADVAEGAERLFAELAHAGRQRQVGPDAAQPADAQALAVAVELQRVGRGQGVRRRQRHPAVEARLHRQQARRVFHGARHRAFDAQLLEEQLLLGVAGHASARRPHADHVVEGGRVAQRAHHVAAVGHGHHAQGERHGRAAAAAARAALGRIGVARDAEHRGVGVRAESELGRVGLADDDGAGGPGAGHVQAVGARRRARRQRRAHRGRQPGGVAQVLHRERKAVHPAAPFAARQLGIALVGLRQRQRRIAQRHDGVERGFSASMRASEAAISSRQDTSRAAMRRESSVALRSSRSAEGMASAGKGGGAQYGAALA